MQPISTLLPRALLASLRKVRDTLSPEQCRVIILTVQAFLWATFARAHAQDKRLALCAKVCESLIFSIAHNAKSFTVPSKLVGVSAYQEALAALYRQDAPFGRRLDLVVQHGRLAVYHQGMMLGFVQDKHEWLRLLVPYRVEVYLIQVTGTENARHTLGLNVAFAGVTGAICRYEATRGA